MRPRRAWIVPLVALGTDCTSPAPPPQDDGGVNLAAAPWRHPDPPARPPSAPRLMVFVTDAARGEGLPCKLTVRGLGGTATPSWGMNEHRGVWLDRESGALGSGRWVLMARGRAAIPLPPGRYRLTVTRGNEYEALSWDDVEVRADRGAIVRAELRRAVETDGEIAGDFHVHSAPSYDSDVALDERLLSLAAEGVEVFAGTDHDAVGDFGPPLRRLGLERHLHWIRGDEISAEGRAHINAYPIPPGLDPAERLPHAGLDVAAIVARARAAAPDAVLQLNHPLWGTAPIAYWRTAGFDPSTGRSSMQLVTGFDAVEVWNGHTLDKGEGGAPVGEVMDAWMASLQMGWRTTATGNSDTHRLTRSPPGWPRTYLRVADDDPARVTDAMVTAALRAGDASLGSGPFLRMTVGGARPGATVRAEGRRVTVALSLQAPSWTPVDAVEVVANRRVVATVSVPAPPPGEPVRLAWSLPVELTRDAWVLARTRAEAPLGDEAGVHGNPMPSLALVNPVYVDVDGDGRWTAPGIDGGP